MIRLIPAILEITVTTPPQGLPVPDDQSMVVDKDVNDLAATQIIEREPDDVEKMEVSKSKKRKIEDDAPLPAKRLRRPNVDDPPDEVPAFDFSVLGTLPATIQESVKAEAEDLWLDIQGIYTDPQWKKAMTEWGLTG